MKRVVSSLLAVIMMIGLMPMIVSEADAANNITVCGIDIGVAAGTHMNFTTQNGTKSESGYYYNGVYLYATQCFGFARWCQYKIFGYHSRQNQKAYYEVSVNGVSDIPAGQLTAAKLKAMISAAKPGAHLRTHENSNGSAHSMIITEITDSGFSIVHANGFPNNEYTNYKQNYVGTYTFTWDSYMDGKHGTYGSRGIDYIELPSDYTFSNPPSSGDKYADIGTGFYAVILNAENWKPITNDQDNYVRLRTETGIASQLWRFDRQSDGSYVISSARDGHALEMYLGNTSSGNPVTASVEDWGGNYQRWYLYEQGKGYVLHSKHYPEKNMVLDLADNNKADGTPIITWPRHNGASQVWAIYRADEVQLKGPTLAVTVGDSKSNTTFTWNEVYGEDKYAVKIWKDKAWVGEPYHTGWGVTSGYGVTLPAGTYQAYVDAYNFYECEMSNTITFTVDEHKYPPVGNLENVSPGIQKVSVGGWAFDQDDLNRKVSIHVYIGNTFIGAGTAHYSRPDVNTVHNVGDYHGFQFDCNVPAGLTGTQTVVVYAIDEENVKNTVLGRSEVNITKDEVAPIISNVKVSDVSSTGYTVSCTVTDNTGVKKVQFPTWTAPGQDDLDPNWASNTSYNGTKNGDEYTFRVKFSDHNDEKSSYMTHIYAYDNYGNTSMTILPSHVSANYSVDFDANGGSGAPSSQTKTHGVNLTLSNTKPTRTNYTFQGWATSASATSAAYQPGATYTGNGNVTLYAVWKHVCANGHSWNAATCTAAKKCKTCGATEGSALGHSWKDATCTAAKTCKTCGKTEGSALGHSWNNATCTAAKTCKTCGKTEGSALGHSWNNATCTAAKTCKTCGKTEGSALGHSWKDATCTTAKTCKTCGATEGSFLGHSYDYKVEKDPTLSATGSIIGICSECKDRTTITLPKLNDKDYTRTVVTKSTCKNEGEDSYVWNNKEYIRNCVFTVTTPIADHDYLNEIITGCVEQGYTKHSCNVCGYTYQDAYTDPAGHSMGDWITMKEASCTESGSRQRSCINCDIVETETVEALGHEWQGTSCTEPNVCKNCNATEEAKNHSLSEWTIEKEATCTAEGNKTRYCTNDGCNYRENELLPLIAHNYATEKTEPTCTEKGYTRWICSGCNHSMVGSYVKALGHDMGEWEVEKEATCTEGGSKKRVCQRDGCDRTETEKIKASGHSHTSEITAPTCTEKGYTTHTCVCGDTYKDSETNALGHKWSEATCADPKTCTACKATEGNAKGHSWTDATCTDPKTCSVCKMTEGTANGHKWSDATCTEPKTCAVCKMTEGTANGHNWTDATCTEPKTCSVCKATEGAANGHKWTDATCTESKTCAVCKMTEGIANGHNWSDANCTEPKTCSVCNATEGEANGHKWSEATCTEPKTCSICKMTEGNAKGHDWNNSSCTEPKTCKVCGVTEGAAAGHSWIDATCTEPKTCSVCKATEGAANGHKWTDATCTEPKTCSVCKITDGAANSHKWSDATCTEAKTCTVCKATEGAANGHNWTEATCTEPKTCSVCKATEGNANGHNWTEATCTEAKTCAVCKATDGDAKGHSWIEATCTEPKTCSVCKTTEGAANGHKWSDATCTEPETCAVCKMTEGDAKGHSWTEATCTEAKICKVCGVTEGEKAPHVFDQEKVEPKYLVSEGVYYKSCKCGEAGTETFAVKEEKPEEKPVEFKDIPQNAYFYNPVMWAVENKITSGTGDGTTFEPNAVCTRGQVVTFLWRAAGQPEPKTTVNPFVDVKTTDYFYKAVLWALENKITTGTGDGTTFEPHANCNRGQIVTFLSRAKNGTPNAKDNPFVDVASNAYYYNPVLWAVENGITTGTGDGTTFEPNADCTRGQVITFLYRAYTK